MEEFEDSAPFFEQLKNIRKKKNLDLNDMAEKSRIQKRYLAAIEEGEFDQIPDIYDKLFFQTYINYLGLDIDAEQQYMEEFRRFRKISEPQHTTTIRRVKTQTSNPKVLERLKKLYIAVPILLVILIIVVLALNSTMVSDEENEPVEELSVRQVARQIEQNQETSLKSSAEAMAVEIPEPSDAGQIDVGITALEDTWLRLIKDKSDTSEYLLRQGNNLALSADSTMEFLIGKANGVKMTVNSSSIEKLGGEGEVVSYLKITNKGVVAKRLKKVRPNNATNDTISNN